MVDVVDQLARDGDESIGQSVSIRRIDELACFRSGDVRRIAREHARLHPTSRDLLVAHRGAGPA